jgi:hypothetical protein
MEEEDRRFQNCFFFKLPEEYTLKENTGIVEM